MHYQVKTDEKCSSRLSLHKKDSLRQIMGKSKKLCVGICALFILITILGTITAFRSVHRSTNDNDASQSVQSSGMLRYSSLEQQKPWENMRLPDWILPKHYQVDLTVDMQNDTYYGFVSIQIVVKEKTKTVIIHEVNLKINHFIIRKDRSMQKVGVINSFAYKRNEFYVIELESYLKVGTQYTLTVFFSGELLPNLNGFYKSYYTVEGEKRKVASTFFSPISARKAFPCFDEPKFKANFTVVLTHSSKYQAISNMPPMAKLYPKHGTITTIFKPTLRMSTYILCWVISEFQFLEKKTKSGIVIKSWASERNYFDTRYGLQTTVTLLEFYENYFKIPYPLEKLDVLAVPNIAAGAMENWGIITFQNARLLMNDKKSQREKRNIFQIIAHELVHQWFGNLATMKFWTDVWLKEGFANYIGMYGGEQLEPSMEFMKNALTDTMLPALEIDSYSTSHAISTTANTPSEVRELFDTITYQKGYCIVQMLHEYLGNDFQSGLQQYLKTYAYRNANQDDLWRELSLVSGKDVKSVMDTWTLQLGFPVITVTRVNKTHIKVKQERFTLDPKNASIAPSKFNYTWQVPVTYKTLDGSYVAKYLLKSKEALLEVSQSIILNPDHAMFYRINYKENMLGYIKVALKTNHTQFTARDRVGLLSDQFSMARANMSRLIEALDMISYIKDEKDYYPWKETLKELLNIYTLNDNTTIKNKLRVYIKGIILNNVNAIGWNKTASVNQGLLQVLLLEVACSMEMKSVKQEAQIYYREWMTNGTMSVEPSLYSTIRGCVLSHGSEKEWNFAYRKYALGGSESDSILSSLTRTQNETLIKRLLMYTNDSNKINSQDAPRVIGKIAEHSDIGRKITWEYLKLNWKFISTKYRKVLFIFPDMLAAVLEQFSSEQDLQDIEHFFADKTDMGGGKQAVSQSIDKIKSNIHQKKIYESSLASWLQNTLYR